MVRVVSFPSQLSVQSVLHFSRELRSEGSTAVEIDFSQAKWMPPFPLLMASSEINRFRRDCPEAKLACARFEHLTYAAHMGFFWSFGLPFGKRPGEALGGENYQPLTVIMNEEIQRAAASKETAVGEIMEGHATALAKVLCRAEGGELFEALSYALREMMRNVVEHSLSDRVAFCAQHWPQKGMVEVGINDWGIGIADSLRRNPELEVTTDADALSLALMPGISGRGAIVKRQKRRDEWTNSGYGLYMTSRLARSGGTFLIGSGGAAVLLDGTGVNPVHWEYPGTAIRLQLRTGNIGILKDRLEGFRRDAAELQEKLGAASIRSPSVASQMLEKDFDRQV
ncbi:MAG: hypothetical protein FIA90_03635 [candidate division NC10 bacterium]|nr:hypothetical protein [candidate division NC10 bacterium]